MSGRIVTLGSCYVDINVAGAQFDQNGIPAEREVLGGSYQLVAGGSAPNFCREITRQERMVATFVGVVGNDVMGESLRNLFTAENIDAKLMQREDVSTGISYNMTGAQGSHIMCVAGTANSFMNESILPTLDEAMEGAEHLYLGGVFKLVGLMNSFQHIVETARSDNIGIILDHGRIPQTATPEQREIVQRLAMSSRYYFPSKDEFLDLWKVASVEEGQNKMIAAGYRGTIVVKDGPNSVHYKNEQGNGLVNPERIENPINVTGAGDTFNAAVISSISDGTPLKESIEHACKVVAAKISPTPVQVPAPAMQAQPMAQTPPVAPRPPQVPPAF